MKGQSMWSYAPYRPFLFEGGEVYVCRIAPGRDSIHLEWLGEGDTQAEIWLRPENEGEFVCIASVFGTQYTIDGLPEGCDYEFFVQIGAKKSRVRLAKTGEAVGTVVNYLHPRDEAYAFSGRYLCSPSLLRLPDGALLASMDLFAPNAPQNLTLIFRSEDDGATWHYQCELMPCFWGKLFLHKDEIYMLACSTEYGDLLIGKSKDGGKTFCAPSVILRGACKSNAPGVHKNPQPVVEVGGRIWNSCEWGAWACGYHAAMVISADADSDLLDPDSWEVTPPVRYDPNWPGTADGPSAGNIEGALTVSPSGQLLNIMRYDMTRATPNFGRVLAYAVDTEHPEAPLAFSRAIDLPGNHSKFMIHRDPMTGMYFSIISRITDANFVSDRRLLSLMVSENLDDWSVVEDLIDFRDRAAPDEAGFQYVDFLFDGDDILYLCRTAMNGAHNFHDANYQTFHRIRNFRTLLHKNI